MLSKHWFTFLSIVFLPNPGETSPSITETTCPNWQILTIRKYHSEAFYQAYYWKIRRSWKQKTIDRLCGVCGYVCVCVCACGGAHLHTHTCSHFPWVSLHLQHGLAPGAYFWPCASSDLTQAPGVSVVQLSGCLCAEARWSPSLRDRATVKCTNTNTLRCWINLTGPSHADCNLGIDTAPSEDPALNKGLQWTSAGWMAEPTVLFW